MEKLKNLCGQIPESLHMRVLEDKGPDTTNGDYLTRVLSPPAGSLSAALIA